MSLNKRNQESNMNKVKASSMRCNHFDTDTLKCHNKISNRRSKFCDAHSVCSYTSEYLRICEENTYGETFCKRHDDFLRTNTYNRYQKMNKNKVVYVKYETSTDPDKIVKEMSGRIKYYITECKYPDFGHQIRQHFLLYEHLRTKKNLK